MKIFLLLFALLFIPVYCWRGIHEDTSEAAIHTSTSELDYYTNGYLWTGKFPNGSDFRYLTISYQHVSLDQIDNGNLCHASFTHVTMQQNAGRLPKLTTEMFGACPSLVYFAAQKISDDWTVAKDAFSQAINLEILRIYEQPAVNEFPDLPPALIELDIIECGITSLDLDIFDGLDRLRMIRLVKNKIQTVDGRLRNVPALKILDLSLNPLKKFPWYALENATSLEQFTLLNTGIDNVTMREFMAHAPEIGKFAISKKCENEFNNGDSDYNATGYCFYRLLEGGSSALVPLFSVNIGGVVVVWIFSKFVNK